MSSEYTDVPVQFSFQMVELLQAKVDSRADSVETERCQCFRFVYKNGEYCVYIQHEDCRENDDFKILEFRQHLDSIKVFIPSGW